MLKEQLKLMKEKLDESMYGTFVNGDADAPVDERLMGRELLLLIHSSVLVVKCL